MRYSGIAVALIALMLGGCGTANQLRVNVNESAKTFNPTIVITSYTYGADGMAIVQNRGVQTAMNLTITDSLGDPGVAKVVYVRMVRIGNKELWITQSPRDPLDLLGGEGAWISFPKGFSFPLKATWTQVDINGNLTTVSRYLN